MYRNTALVKFRLLYTRIQIGVYRFSRFKFFHVDLRFGASAVIPHGKGSRNRKPGAVFQFAYFVGMNSVSLIKRLS